MDDRVKNIKTPQQCEVFAKNANDKGRPDLAKQAKQRAIQLKAEDYEVETDAEKEAIEAVYAYEEVLTLKNKKKTRAARIWPMIKRHGVIPAIEKTVNREADPEDYSLLVEIGLKDYAFEAMVIRHAQLFDAECVDISKQRIAEWTGSE
ncbi:MAG: hypothetical protein KUG79_02935 [Pseudomonadales bacterium]|nr:hypothetical protein [Pseudomonadales bacterium]